ncbi:MAG: cytochrome c oxidase subunit II [Haloferacaceae archaeon]
MTYASLSTLLLQVQPGEWRSQVNVFDELFLAFVGLGTLVGIVVVSYTLYNALKYRDGGGSGPADDEADRPVLGELPTGEGGKKSRKLFLSFGLSAVIVISLVVYSYTLLIYVESGPDVEPESELEVDVVGYQFGWEFQYPNGHAVDNELRVPADQVVRLHVTSRDVWHSFGVPELRVKSDAIPGQTSTTWFSVDESGTYTAECFELCGAGHSYMKAEIVVMEPAAFEEWYAGTGPDGDSGDAANGENAGNETSASIVEPTAGPVRGAAA